jgi:hypothetical protein
MQATHNVTLDPEFAADMRGDLGKFRVMMLVREASDA